MLLNGDGDNVTIYNINDCRLHVVVFDVLCSQPQFLNQTWCVAPKRSNLNKVLVWDVCQMAVCVPLFDISNK
jgi:hypothetical protein